MCVRDNVRACVYISVYICIGVCVHVDVFACEGQLARRERMFSLSRM